MKISYSELDFHRFEEHHHHKLIGGRFLFVYTLEFRNRIAEDFGLVGFYDIGNVYFDSWPNSKRHLLQSAGIGIRYYTPVGSFTTRFGSSHESKKAH